MADKSPIEWTDSTWNPVTGCTLVSAGCKNCYAATLAATRLKNHPSRAGLARINAAGEAKFTGEVRFNEQWLDQPLRWRKPRRIFVCAHGDLFHESVPDDWIDRVFAVMALCPQHTFQVLTKRPQRMRDYMARTDERGRWPALDYAAVMAATGSWNTPALDLRNGWPLPNVWLGTSVEDQATADARIPHLLATPAAVRFVSAEPLLGPVDLTLDGLVCLPCPNVGDGLSMDPTTGAYECCSRCDYTGIGSEWGIDWLIVGGESGPNARPMHPDWPRALRDQCVSAGVAYFFKQWGGWAAVYDREIDDPDWQHCDTIAKETPNGRWMNITGGHGFHGDRVVRVEPVAKKTAGRQLDGRTWDEMPGVRHG